MFLKHRHKQILNILCVFLELGKEFIYLHLQKLMRNTKI